MKKHNFYAGPAILPEIVLKEAAQSIINFNNSELSLLEISHRSKGFEAVMDESESLVKELLGIGEEYAVLFLTGCHGSKGLSAFAVPESFDETRNYEITFWAKNDTNKTQTAIYQNPKGCILFLKFVPSGCKYFLLML